VTEESEKDPTDVLRMVSEAVTSWAGVESRPHRFGGTEFRVEGKEMGHMHGSRLADFPFPMSIRNQLVRDGKAEPHHVLPDSGWVSYWIGDDRDAEPVISLFRMQYERLVKSAIKDNH
jgi:hypothetical protein